jgi:hypothetical protein
MELLFKQPAAYRKPRSQLPQLRPQIALYGKTAFQITWFMLMVPVINLCVIYTLFESAYIAQPFVVAE